MNCCSGAERRWRRARASLRLSRRTVSSLPSSRSSGRETAIGSVSASAHSAPLPVAEPRLSDLYNLKLSHAAAPPETCAQHGLGVTGGSVTCRGTGHRLRPGLGGVLRQRLGQAECPSQPGSALLGGCRCGTHVLYHSQWSWQMSPYRRFRPPPWTRSFEYWCSTARRIHMVPGADRSPCRESVGICREDPWRQDPEEDKVASTRLATMPVHDWRDMARPSQLGRQGFGCRAERLCREVRCLRTQRSFSTGTSPCRSACSVVVTGVGLVEDGSTGCCPTSGPRVTRAMRSTP
jgi:hypothetical protein